VKLRQQTIVIDVPPELCFEVVAAAGRRLERSETESGWSSSRPRRAIESSGPSSFSPWIAPVPSTTSRDGAISGGAAASVSMMTQPHLSRTRT
jgi:hypothetical protein